MRYNEFDSYYRPSNSSSGSFSQQPAQVQPQEPVPPQPPVKKSRRGLRITAVVLSCVLVLGAAFGVGYLGGSGVFSPRETTQIYVSDRKPVEVQPMAVTGQQEMTLTEIYASNVNSAVSIRATTTTNYFGQAVESASAGSGFIITKDGYIVTNNHVVEGASKTAVTLYDGTEFEAVVIGTDEDFDIAVLKINPGDHELTPVVIGDSSALQVGDTVAAIGNPLGELTFSMTSGIVSCVDRLINVDGIPFNMIQIDAAVNSGNSGGPLFNTYGEVIGIVSAKYSRSSSNASVEGLGFAIPINDVSTLIEDLMTDGYVSKPTLSLFGGTFSPSMVPNSGTDSGLYVYSVEEGGAAAKAGLQAGDVIVKVGDYEVTSLDDITALKKHYSAGDTVTVEYYRNGTKQTTELTFDASIPTTQTSEETSSADNGYEGYDNYYTDPWDYFNRFFGGSPFFGSYSGQAA